MATNTIAVIAPFQGVGEKVLVGVADYFQKQTRLKMRPIHLDANVNFDNMDLSRMGGAIIVDMLEEMPQALRDLNIPKVEVFERNHKEGVPLVSVDNDQIGALAAQHLYGRGFKHFAFVGGVQEVSGWEECEPSPVFGNISSAFAGFHARPAMEGLFRPSDDMAGCASEAGWRICE